MLRPLTRASLILAFVASLGIQMTAAADALVETRARLFGPSMKGQARYLEKMKNGQLLRRFKVEIENATPGNVHEVAVNDVVYGTITVGPLGKGKFELRTPAFIDSPEDGLPMPDDFPALDTGDVVTVGPITGIIFDRLDDSVQRIKLRTDFGGSGASGKVRYRERFKNGQGLERRFEVNVEDAPAGEQFDITVNGQFVGTLISSGGGDETEFQLRTAAFIDSPDDGDPMPGSFPSLREGDVVTVGPFIVVLEND